MVESKGVAVNGPAFSKESWFCDSSRSLSKFLQLASKGAARSQASWLTGIRSPSSREHVRALNAGRALLSLKICQAWRKEQWQEISSGKFMDRSDMQRTNLSQTTTYQPSSRSCASVLPQFKSLREATYRRSRSCSSPDARKWNSASIFSYLCAYAHYRSYACR